ncbi:CREB-regulated transcription coactivator 1 isoform X2 [Cherax quadricarinatus]|uniref:CREB-regulated transcription coactivator 1 isoform X2 n=1 Tax=Cherax quadricarinatus TaxID=27406 RepID=UPI00387E5FC5
MATPSPRKFQEKIALLQQREAEGKLEYEQIMTEVQGLTRAPKPPSQGKQQQLLQPQTQHHHLQQHQHQQPQPQHHSSRPPQGGSLPDFSINLPGAMQDLNNLRQEVYPGGGISHQRIPVPQQMRQHQHSQHLATSPTRLHGYNTLLSPPEALSRSISDSSLHQNLVQSKTVNSRKVSAPVEGVRTDPSMVVSFYESARLGHDTRPKSGCELTHPSDISAVNHIQRSANIPIPTSINNVGGAGPGGGGGGGGVGALPNTGSLPDLTQVQYLQPMNPPLPDTDLATLQSLSAGSPRLGSGFPSGTLGDPYSSGQASPRGTSPGPSPSLSRKQKQKPYQPLHINRVPHHSQSKNHLSVPTVINARYLHTCKGMTVDNSSTTVDTHLANSGLNLFGQPLSPSGSHPASPNHLSFMDYRNPVSPQLSPRSSPGPCHTLHTGGLGSYSSNSPSDSRSAPPSPSAPQASPASSPGISISKPFNYEYQTHAQTNQLNQQFEQCNMVSINFFSSSYFVNVFLWRAFTTLACL